MVLSLYPHVYSVIMLISIEIYVSISKIYSFQQKNKHTEENILITLQF